MKRIYQLIAVTVVALLVPLVAVTPASAVATCEIGYTGPDSNNMCTSVETYRCSINNDNVVTIVNSSNQTAASGSVTVDENGTGGGAVSGNVGNNNNATFTVTVTNGDEARVCSAVVRVPATETPPTVTPVSPTATSKTPAKALPVTGDDTTLSTLAIVAGIAGGVAVLSVASVLAYRRINAS